MIDVRHVAKLANLPLTSEEEKKFEKQLASILDLVGKLQKVDTAGVLPTPQVTGQVNVFRDDEIESDRVLTQDEALSNAGRAKNGFFVAPKILDV